MYNKSQLRPNKELDYKIDYILKRHNEKPMVTILWTHCQNGHAQTHKTGI